MLPLLLFVFYAVLLSMVLLRSKRIRQTGIAPMVLLGAFAFKVALGCLYGYIFITYYGGDDTWEFHRESLEEYQKLFHHPGVFFYDLLPFKDFAASPGFFDGLQLYLMNLETWLMVKGLAFFNLFSRGNYYINTLFFDFLVLSGPLFLFRLLSTLFPGKHRTFLVVLFFIPSLTFWLSGIRSEGLLLSCLAIILYYSYKAFLHKRFSYPLMVLLGLAGVLVFRTQFLFTFFPAWIGLIMALKFPQKAFTTFCIVYGICAVVFFGSLLFSGRYNLPMAVVEKQQGFFRLSGNTRFALDSLRPSVASFAGVLPQAASNTLLRPFLWEAKGLLQIATALSNMALWLLALMAALRHEQNLRRYLTHPLILAFLFYGFSQMMLVGLTVPFPGAITRYIVIPQLFLVAALTIITDWQGLLPALKLKK